jgi:hypothetical protein
MYKRFGGGAVVEPRRKRKFTRRPTKKFNDIGRIKRRCASPPPSLRNPHLYHEDAQATVLLDIAMPAARESSRMFFARLANRAKADGERRVFRAQARLRKCLGCSEDCHRSGISKT